MLNGLDLFSGIGGITLALTEWVNPVAYCENDRFAQAVLLSRMFSGELPRAPIWDDVTSLGPTVLPVGIDIIYGGFPCQDISCAGNAAGMAGGRSGLFQEIARLTEEIRPTFVFLENVPAITTRGLDTVLGALTALRYDCRWTVVSAREVGAPHLRKRWFLLAADADRIELRKQPGGGCGASRKSQTFLSSPVEARTTSNTDCEGSLVSGTCVRNEKKEPFSLDVLEGDDWDEYASFLLRMDHGLPYRAHKIKGLGNAVVPQQARAAFKMLMGIQ